MRQNFPAFPVLLNISVKAMLEEMGFVLIFDYEIKLFL